MSEKHSRRLTPSMVVALAALFVALSGNAVASGPESTVARLLGLTGKQSSQVKKIASSVVTSRAPGLSVKFAATAGTATNATNATNATTAGTATTATFATAAGTATTATFATTAGSAASATNATNATNAVSALTAAGLTGVVYVQSGTVSNPMNNQTEGVAICPTGDIVLGGGVRSSAGAPSAQQDINSSFPFDSTGSYEWRAYVDNNGSGNATFTVFAICAPGTGSGI
jgi:hypothetical protein